MLPKRGLIKLCETGTNSGQELCDDEAGTAAAAEVDERCAVKLAYN